MAKYEVELHSGQGPKLEVEADQIHRDGDFLEFSKRHTESSLTFGRTVKLLAAHLVRSVTLVSE